MLINPITNNSFKYVCSNAVFISFMYFLKLKKVTYIFKIVIDPDEFCQGILKA